MDTGTIATIVMSLMIMPALAWVLRKTSDHNEKLVILGRNQDETNNKLSNLVKSFDNMSNKLDMFLKQELDAFKKLSEDSTDAINKIALSPNSPYKN